MSLPVVDCPHRPPCPGCPRFGEALASAPAFAPLRELAAEAGIVTEHGPSTGPLGYRHRARLAIRGRASSPKVGIFEAGSHRVADIPRCLVHHPLINVVASALKEAVRELGVFLYAESSQRGLLRYLQVVVERATHSAQLVLVANTEDRGALEPLFSRLGELLGDRLQGLFFSAHTAPNNVVLGPRCEKVRGRDAVRERIAGADVFFPPDAFGQGNLGGYERIVEQMGNWVGSDRSVVEFYAGTGAIGLALLPRAQRVTFNEIAAGSLRGLRMGIDALAPELQARAQVAAGAVAKHAELAAGSDVVIADPPRKGLDPALLRVLINAPPQRFLYLSCGLESFLRDARALRAASKLRLTELVLYDLFPFTDHVETLACFERVA